MKIQPPKRALKFLRWFCREDFIEEIEGDLMEIFEEEFEQLPSRARRKFAWSVIKHFRPAFIKSFKSRQSLNPTAMLRHNLLISYRNIRRYKGSFLLNLAGLSTGLACAILIYMWVNDEMSIDRFHKNDSKLYQILKVATEGDGTVHTSEFTPVLMHQTMKEDLPEVEYSSAVINRDYGVASIKREHIKARPQFVSNDFFKVFSFNLLEGDKNSVLTDRNTVILTDKMALKLFNTTKGLIGQTIEWEWWEVFNGTYTVGGIVEAPGSNSSMQFDILFLDDLWLERNKKDGNWYSNNSNTYVVLKDGTNIPAFADKIKEYSRKKLVQLHGKEGLQYEGTLILQQYSDRYLHSEFENGVPSGGPGVISAAGMSGNLVGMHGGGGGIEWEGKRPDENIQFSGLYIGNNLIEMLGLTMDEGEPFSPSSTPGIKKVIFNETAIKMMRLKDPVGKKVKMWGEEREIVGVVKDFHYESLYEQVGPLFLRHEDENNMNTMVKIKAGMESETLAKIEKFYKEYNNDQPFEHQFLDQDFQMLYSAENRVAILSRYFAGIAILISCLGLFGLTAFTAERRAKEIGIRKILGLGEIGIVYLLSKDFTKIVLLAIVFAIPVSYYLGQEWMRAFAYHVEMEWWFFAAPATVAMLIAWLTIGAQSIKAANVNPITVLKSE